MIAWGRYSEPHEWPSRIDRAISADFDPHEPPDEPKLGPITPAMARRVHQGSTGCAQCGERCDRCDERMCSTWGPEPRACGVTCVECPCDCTACLQARDEMRADLLHRIEGEGL